MYIYYRYVYIYQGLLKLHPTNDLYFSDECKTREESAVEQVLHKQDGGLRVNFRS
jgi:hypothetical protein